MVPPWWKHLVELVDLDAWSSQQHLDDPQVAIPGRGWGGTHQAAHIRAVQPPDTVLFTLVVGCSSSAATTLVCPLHAATTSGVEVDIRPVRFWV